MRGSSVFFLLVEERSSDAHPVDNPFDIVSSPLEASPEVPECSIEGFDDDEILFPEDNPQSASVAPESPAGTIDDEVCST